MASNHVGPFRYDLGADFRCELLLACPHSGVPARPNLSSAHLMTRCGVNTCTEPPHQHRTAACLAVSIFRAPIPMTSQTRDHA